MDQRQMATLEKLVDDAQHAIQGNCLKHGCSAHTVLTGVFGDPAFLGMYQFLHVRTGSYSQRGKRTNPDIIGELEFTCTGCRSTVIVNLADDWVSWNVSHFEVR